MSSVTCDFETPQKCILCKIYITEHYAVANNPGAVSNIPTIALTNSTLKYALALADKGWRKACKEDKALYRGLNIVNGKVVFKTVTKEEPTYY